MLPSVTFLDLETTGATPLRDRITEIALVRIENGVEVARWQTLVNPEQDIPEFIQRLTGINNEMVANAPTFAQVASQLLAFLEGSVLAAHNVRFDHGFIKAELKRLNLHIRQKVICTVKLSRLLYPQHRSHGLDAIMQRHQLTTVARHRAMGDVELMLAFIEAAKLELGEAAIINGASQLMRGPNLPLHLDAQILDEIPETPGVYLFFGENNLPLYIGKSVNIRARILSHFSSDHSSTKEMRISQDIKRIEWIETAGDFSAQLLESSLVKSRLPIYNRQLRNERQLCSWQLVSDPIQLPQVTLMREDEINSSDLDHFYGTFKTKRQAVEVLRELAAKHQLCLRGLGLEASADGVCFAYQLKRCKGLCCGKETLQMHYLRLQMALAAHRLKNWPFAGKIAIREFCAESAKTALHVFENWTYLGCAEDDMALTEIMQYKPHFKFDLDTYKLLLKTLNQAKTEVISLAN